MTGVRLSYEEFAKTAQQFSEDRLAALAQQEKPVYVCALTRDLYASCEIEKPLYEKLANAIYGKHGELVKLNAIHVPKDAQFRSKLQDLRRILTFAA